jgi:hypothetical protein
MGMWYCSAYGRFMAKEKQQELPQQAEVTRLAVSISRSADGKYVVEELQLLGNEVAHAETLVVKAAGIRVASGEMILALEERLVHWQRTGVLK